MLVCCVSRVRLSARGVDDNLFNLMTRTNLSFLNLLNQTQIVLYPDAGFCVAFKPHLYQNLESPQTTPLILTEECFTYMLLRIVSLSSLDLHVWII